MIRSFVFLQVLSILVALNEQVSDYNLTTFTSQERRLEFNHNDSPYQINVKRLASTTPS